MKTHLHILRGLLTAFCGALIIPAALATADSLLPVAAVRATTQLGADVFAADGARVGTVADFILQFDALPQLRYVIVKSRASFGEPADQRAIPADAVTLVDHCVHVTLASDYFEHLPVLPANHRRFLSFADNLTNLAKLCGTPLEHAGLTGDYVAFSDLSTLDDIMGEHGEELGLFADLWIDFNANECPYLEYAPTSGPVDLFGNLDYDLPTTALEAVTPGRIHFSVSEADLAHVRTIDDASAFVAAAGEKLETAQARSGP